jgi:hypothetical protein
MAADINQSAWSVREPSSWRPLLRHALYYLSSWTITSHLPLIMDDDRGNGRTSAAWSSRRIVSFETWVHPGKTSFPELLDCVSDARPRSRGRATTSSFSSRRGFIKRVDGEHIDFYYRGLHQNVLETVSRSDVVWTSRLMARPSDTQWDNAFRAAGCPATIKPDASSRKSRTKVAEALKLGEVS